MKCERCNNEMVWKGSFADGMLVCEYCENDDDMLSLSNEVDAALAYIEKMFGEKGYTLSNGDEQVRVYREGSNTIVECKGGGGGIGVADQCVVGGSGGMTAQQAADQAAHRLAQVVGGDITVWTGGITWVDAK